MSTEVSSQSDWLARRGMKPAAQLGETKPHGTRIRYVGGCRCDECRRANTRYETERARARRAGDWNGIVSAQTAWKHLIALSRRGGHGYR